MSHYHVTYAALTMPSFGQCCTFKRLKASACLIDRITSYMPRLQSNQCKHSFIVWRTLREGKKKRRWYS